MKVLRNTMKISDTFSQGRQATEIRALHNMRALQCRRTPVASNDVNEVLQRRIMAGKIQCVATSTRATFAKLQADGHWLAEYFEPIEVTPADEETSTKVLGGIKGFYETFHNVSYTDDAVAHAVFWQAST